MERVEAARPSRPPLPDVVAEHLEELAFLTVQRRKLIFSPELPPRRIATHDERIEAHLDGLRIGARASLPLAQEKLASDDPWELFSAARVFLELARPDAESLVRLTAKLGDDLLGAWREALRSIPRDLSRAWLPHAPGAALPPASCALAVDAALARGDGDALAVRELARHAEPVVRGALARGLARGADARRFAELARELAGDADPQVSRRALWSAARLDPAWALERCRRQTQGAVADPFALRVLGLCGSPEDCDLLAAASAHPQSGPAALQALAELGTPEAIESLIERLGQASDELRSSAAAALERALGTIPREDRNKTPTPEQAQAHWAGLRADSRRVRRWCLGAPLPWSGDPREQPMLWRWRALATGARQDPEWLGHEVPDGFFADVPVEWAVPGE
jgi:hypothetical protein